MTRFKKQRSTQNYQYFFHFVGGNGETIIVSEQYTTIQNCENGIASVRIHASYEKYYQRFVDVRGEFRFNLLASNGKIIATSSEGYKTYLDREHAIELVKRMAPSAPVQDLTW